MERKSSRPSQVGFSTHWEDEVQATGVLDDDPARNPLAGANKVYVWYCTSDAWVGHALASPATFGWHFMGAAVVDALFNARNKRTLYRLLH